MSEPTPAQKMLTHEDYPHLSTEEWAGVYRLALVIGSDAIGALLLIMAPQKPTGPQYAPSCHMKRLYAQP